MAPSRQPGYSPLKIFDPWFCRGVQSAIFHYATCQDYKNWKSAKERSKQSEKAAKAREAELAIITEQPKPIPHMQPLPFQTNKGWLPEINMGRDFDPMKARKNRRVSSGNTRSRADTGDTDRYDYYRSKNPHSNDQSPPIATRLPPPERRNEVAWMKAPAPSRAIMEGKENPTLDPPQRWPLCNIDRTLEELAFEETPQELASRIRRDGLWATYKERQDRILLRDTQREALRREERAKAQATILAMSPVEVAAALLPKPQNAYFPKLPTKRTPDFKNKALESSMTESSTSEIPTSESLRICSWESMWDSEPDMYGAGKVGLPRPRGNPRISSLVAVQNGRKLEIRGASYTYDMFWKNDRGSYET